MKGDLATEPRGACRLAAISGTDVGSSTSTRGRGPRLPRRQRLRRAERLPAHLQRDLAQVRGRPGAERGDAVPQRRVQDRSPTAPSSTSRTTSAVRIGLPRATTCRARGSPQQPAWRCSPGGGLRKRDQLYASIDSNPFPWFSRFYAEVAYGDRVDVANNRVGKGAASRSIATSFKPAPARRARVPRSPTTTSTASSRSKARSRILAAARAAGARLLALHGARQRAHHLAAHLHRRAPSLWEQPVSARESNDTVSIVYGHRRGDRTRRSTSGCNWSRVRESRRRASRATRRSSSRRDRGPSTCSRSSWRRSRASASRGRPHRLARRGLAEHRAEMVALGAQLLQRTASAWRDLQQRPWSRHRLGRQCRELGRPRPCGAASISAAGSTRVTNPAASYGFFASKGSPSSSSSAARWYPATSGSR